MTQLGGTAAGAAAGVSVDPAPPLSKSTASCCRCSMLAKSRRTAANYQSALRRFTEFLEDDGHVVGELTTDRLQANVLERFYTSLLKHYGREKRSTCIAYTTEVRAFFRFLD